MTIGWISTAVTSSGFGPEMVGGDVALDGAPLGLVELVALGTRLGEAVAFEVGYNDGAELFDGEPLGSCNMVGALDTVGDPEGATDGVNVGTGVVGVE